MYSDLRPVRIIYRATVSRGKYAVSRRFLKHSFNFLMILGLASVAFAKPAHARPTVPPYGIPGRGLRRDGLSWFTPSPVKSVAWFWSAIVPTNTFPPTRLPTL